MIRVTGGKFSRQAKVDLRTAWKENESETVKAFFFFFFTKGNALGTRMKLKANAAGFYLEFGNKQINFEIC